MTDKKNLCETCRIGSPVGDNKHYCNKLGKEVGITNVCKLYEFDGDCQWDDH